MPLVPTNYPDLVAARGVPVNVLSGWESRGSSADHQAVVLHHTASSSSESPSSCANYVFLGASAAPDYNVLCDRDGVAWIGAREKSNSSGDISSTALNEALRGQAGCVSAGERGLRDDTSANSKLFAIAAQNNGVGEHWGDAMVNAMNVCAAVALQCLGLSHAGYVTQHRVLTARKIDNCGDSCPRDFQPGINDVLGGRGPVPSEVPEMWVVQGILPNGTQHEPGELLLPLPSGRKAGTTWCMLYLDAEPEGDNGASLWGASLLAGTAFGAWNNGAQWELWLPPRYPVGDRVRDDAYQLRFQNRGKCGPVTVSVYGN